MCGQPCPGCVSVAAAGQVGAVDRDVVVGVQGGAQVTGEVFPAGVGRLERELDTFAADPFQAADDLLERGDPCRQVEMFSVADAGELHLVGGGVGYAG